MTDFWKVLAIAPTDDVKLIKRAYAARLKQVRPDDDPQGFQQLREAYEWALEYGVKWFAYAQEDDDIEEDAEPAAEASVHEAPAQRSPELEREPASAEAAIEQHVVPFVPSYRRKVDAGSVPPPTPDDIDEPAPTVFVESTPSAMLALEPQTVRVSSEFLPDLRSIDQFLGTFYQLAEQMHSQEQAEQWLEAQPEWISLPFRRNLDAALEQNFAQMHWPWPAVLAVSKLLEWESIGAGRRDLMIVRRARLHARASLTPKPTLFSFFSKSATAYMLLRPPMRGWRLIRPLLPISHWVKELFLEVQSQGLAPDEIFDVNQVNIEQNLQSKVLNGTNLARIVVDAMFIIVVVQLLGGYKASDNSLLVLALIIFMGLFAVYSLIRVIASLRLMRQSYFRLLWTQSLRARMSGNAVPPWSLLVPVITGLGYTMVNLENPLLAILGSAALLHCMRAPLRFTWLPLVAIGLALSTASIYFWPTANQVLHALSALAIGGFVAAVAVWLRIRKQGIVAHMQVEFTPLLVAGGNQSEGKPQNVSWIVWLLAFMLLRAITSMG